jgi:KaiC/GvpD/RAD55 family RecA-like ATPase
MTTADTAISKIDTFRRARQMGSMVVTGGAEAYDVPPERVLVDLDQMSGKDLLATYEKRHANYGTAPFDPAGDVLRFYPGGVTIWSGFPGAGKTTLLRQTICHFLARGSSVFLASLEEDPADVLVRLAATAAGRTAPTSHQVQWFLDAYRERFRLWGVIGIAQHRQLLAVIRMLAEQGVRHAVIDSLMCLDIANDDYEGQRKFVTLLSATARAAKIHLHLVAHPRKLINADQEPDLNDVAGAREIGGIADNVLFVRRKKGKTDYGMTDTTPMCISIKKQRHFNGSLVDIEGYFQRCWRQFSVGIMPSAPIRYLPDDAYEVRA